MPIRIFLYISRIADDDPICFRHFMPDDEFADVARQLEETLSELNQVSDPTLRRTLLSDMRRLIAEADRLAAEAAQPKWEDKADNRKQGR